MIKYATHTFAVVSEYVTSPTISKKADFVDWTHKKKTVQLSVLIYRLAGVQVLRNAIWVRGAGGGSNNTFLCIVFRIF